MPANRERRDNFIVIMVRLLPTSTERKTVNTGIIVRLLPISTKRTVITLITVRLLPYQHREGDQHHSDYNQAVADQHREHCQYSDYSQVVAYLQGEEDGE